MFDIGLIVEFDGTPKDLVVTVGEDATGKTLYEIVASKTRFQADRGSLVVHRTGETLAFASTLAEQGLRWGDRLTAVPTPAPSRKETAPFVLDAVEGPLAGERVQLDVGVVLFGRGAEVGNTTLDDPAMSRRHASLEVTPTDVTITDLGSKNGTLISDREISGPTRLPPGETVIFGDTVFRLIPGTTRPPAHLEYSNGRLLFNRQPRLPDPDPARTFHLETPPATPPRRRIPMASALAPMALGVVMAFQNPFYLLMAGMGPVVMIFNVLDDRKSGRKKFAQESLKYRQKLDALRREVTDASSAEASWAARRWPALEVIIGLVRSCDPRLWWRRHGDVDFLDLRVGTCDQPSRVRVDFSPGGDDQLLAAAQDVCAVVGQSPQAPAVVHLRTAGVLGVCGPPTSATAHARWLVAQLATLHSPRDVALVVIAPGAEDAWSTAKWLPHAFTLDDSRPLLAFTNEDAAAMFTMLRDLAQSRRDALEESFGGRIQLLPQVVVVIQPPLRVSRRVLSEFLTGLAEIGMAVIWLASDRGELPGECQMVVEVVDDDLVGSLWETGAERAALAPHIEQTTATDFGEIATGVAALRDTSSSGGSGGLPNIVNLLDLLDTLRLSAADVERRWANPPDTLRAVIGHDGEGPVELDLELDGPHGLVAGTSGAGKSEFLQALVASLALTHPPSRVNFILIDYKGGSAFKNCRLLPHTVGFVTDLDGHLADRAMISLKAEQTRREHVITKSGGAKDLADFRQRRPDEAPPSLVIVVDEFAFLAKEVPEFVDQLVDVAQRGRSLGVHLLLATQRPSGIISPQIQANATLRVALRVGSAADSSDVIDRPDAVTISNRNRGRAIIKTGHGALRVVQSAYVGGAASGDTEQSQVSGETFVLSSVRESAKQLATGASSGDVDTDLDRIVVSIRTACDELGIPDPQRPWLEPLGRRVSLDDLENAASGSIPAVALGLADLPARQMSEPWILDLEAVSHYVTYGGPGSGKTTLLRSSAVALARALPPEALHFYGIDFGQDGLQVLEDLPHWGGTATAREMPRVHRLVTLLEEIAEERRKLLTATRVGTPTEYRNSTGNLMAEIVVLVDNLSAFNSAMEPIENQVALGRFHRLVADGRGVGIHFLITADRAGAVPSVLTSAIGGQLVLRMSNPQEYSMLGRPELVKAEALPPGRAFTRDGTEVQIAVVGATSDADAMETNRVLEAVQHLAQSTETRTVPLLRLLPGRYDLAHLDSVPTLEATPLGIDERYAPVTIGLSGDPRFLVVGPARSGRSTALATLVRGLRSACPDQRAYLIATRRTSLVDLGGWERSSTTVNDASELLAALVTEARNRAANPSEDRLLVVVDDGDDLAEGSGGVAGQLDTLQKAASDAGLILLASVSTFKAQRTFSSWLGALRNNQHGLLLAGSADSADVFQARLPRASIGEVPPGRGYLFTPGGSRLIQVAV